MNSVGTEGDNVRFRLSPNVMISLGARVKRPGERRDA
jgi:hypothetical protein